jgi:hypothetical protein
MSAVICLAIMLSPQYTMRRAETVERVRRQEKEAKTRKVERAEKARMQQRDTEARRAERARKQEEDARSKGRDI